MKKRTRPERYAAVTAPAIGRTATAASSGVRLLLFFAATCVFVRTTAAQSQFPNQDSELWNSETLRVGRSRRRQYLFDFGVQSDFDSFYQLRGGAGFSLHELLAKPGVSRLKIAITPRYHFYHRTKTPLELQDENRFSTDVKPYFTRRGWRFVDRNRGEYRLMQGRHYWRYRNRVEIHYSPEARPQFFRLADTFARYEFFCDVSHGNCREARLTAGGKRWFHKHYAAQIYYLRQWHGSGAPRAVSAVAISFQIRFLHDGR